MWLVLYFLNCFVVQYDDDLSILVFSVINRIKHLILTMVSDRCRPSIFICYSHLNDIYTQNSCRCIKCALKKYFKTYSCGFKRFITYGDVWCDVASDAPLWSSHPLWPPWRNLVVLYHFCIVISYTFRILSLNVHLIKIFGCGLIIFLQPTAKV